jgi:hypothetical protein
MLPETSISEPNMKNLPASTSHRNQSLRLRPVIAAVVIWLAVVGGLSYNRQGIVDAWRLHDYTPTPEVAALASTMTPSARDVFYVNNPQVTDKAPFASSCPSSTGRCDTGTDQ